MPSACTIALIDEPTSPGRESHRPRMHLFTTANQRHGGFLSACALMKALRGTFRVTARALGGKPPAANHERLAACAESTGDFHQPPVAPGDHVLVHMNDYPVWFGNAVQRWREIIEPAASVQFVFNRVFGAIPKQPWLAEHVTRIYFHSSAMEASWRLLVRDSPLLDVPTQVLSPPAELSALRRIALRPVDDSPVVIGRLAGDADLPDNAPAFYARLADALPTAEFWFMPCPEPLADAFAGNGRFRFFDRDGMAVADFLAACHVYALTYHHGFPVPGPRSLMEAMAAGCAPVVIDRDGPRDRVVHGESGFRSNDDDAFITYVVSLAGDAALRDRIARAARQRTLGWGPMPWVEAITRHALGGNVA